RSSRRLAPLSISSVTPTPALYTPSLPAALPILLTARDPEDRPRSADAALAALRAMRADFDHRVLALRADVEPDEVAEIAGEATRSEEHTSELQSRENLVCRLLLEKKKERVGRSV